MSDDDSAVAADPAPSFARDVAPILAPFRANMRWRLDLLDYGAVKANASIILDQVNASAMPPAPMPPIGARELSILQRWVDGGCLP